MGSSFSLKKASLSKNKYYCNSSYQGDQLDKMADLRVENIKLSFHITFILHLAYPDLCAFIRQNEQLLLLSYLPTTYGFWDLKFQFQCLVYFFSGRWLSKVK